MNVLTVPQGLPGIRPDWLTQALSASIPAGPFPAVTGFSTEPIAQGRGFMNQLYRLRLEYARERPGLPSTVIAKLPSADPLLHSVSQRLGQNTREVRFYRELGNNPHLPVPSCYCAAADPDTGDAVLLLEDMCHARQGDSVAGCSMDEAIRALTALARFHAAWWDSPALHDLDWIPVKRYEIDAYLAIYPGAWQALKYKAGNGMPDDLSRLGDRLVSDVPRIKTLLSESPITVVHGDYRLDNCFWTTEDPSQPPVVFDWEFCALGRGPCDVATFINEAFPAQRRRQVEPDLLRAYHDALLHAGVTGYSYDRCWRDYRLGILESFVFWIITGGYCDFSDTRATTYLHNTMARFNATITDLTPTNLLTP